MNETITTKRRHVAVIHVAALACWLSLMMSHASTIGAQAGRQPTPQQEQPQPSPQPTPPTAPRINPDVTQSPQRAPIENPPPDFGRPLGSDTRTPRALTLAEVVRLTFEQTSPLQQARLDERIAAQDVRQAKRAFLPTFSMPVGTTLYTPRAVAEGERRVTSENGISLAASGEADLSGRLRASLRRSRYLLEAARAGTLVARRALTLVATDAYYNLVLARERRYLSEETLSLAEAFRKITEARLARGEGDESDLFRARVKVAEQRDEFESARADESAAIDAVRALTGIDFEMPVDLPPIETEIPPTTDATDFSSYTAQLLDGRPELRQLEGQRLAALEEARGERRARYFPQLSYVIADGYEATNFRRPFTRNNDGIAAFAISFPLFDFGMSRSRETQARLRAESFAVQQDFTVRLLRQEFYTARTSTQSALRRISVTQAGMAAAQRSLTIIFTNYRLDKATVNDVVDAQSDYADARLAYFQAITDFHLARVRLETLAER